MSRKFPLHVFYPHGGRHYLVLHYEHDRGNSLIVARSEKAARKAAQHAVFTSYEVKFREALVVDIVAPSHAIKASFARNTRRQQLWNIGIFYHIHHYYKKYNWLPPGFSIKDGDVVHDTLSLSEVYDRYEPAWTPPKKSRRSEAPPARNEPLWMASLDEGPHCAGVFLSPAERLCHTPAFFFHKVGTFDLSDVESVRSHLRKLSEDKRRQERARSELESQEKSLAEFEAFKKRFE